MSRILTGDKLISSVRKRAMIPDDTSVFTDQDILDIANEELDVNLIDKLLTLHEEHLTQHVDIDRNATGVYDVPYRAVGNKIRDISLVINENDIRELSQISISELSDYSHEGDGSYGNYKFYVENNQIKIINRNMPYNKVRIYYYIRPSVLTKTSRSATVQSKVISGNNLIITLSTIPSVFNSSSVFDIVGYRTPNKIKEIDLPQVSLDTSTKTLSIALSNILNVDEIKVGDYVTLAEESPVPNIPTEMHPLLSQLASIHILEATGDTEALANAERRKELMEKSIIRLVDDRVELAPKKIKPRHGVLEQSLIRSSTRHKRRY